MGVSEKNSMLLPRWAEVRKVEQTTSGATRPVVSKVWSMAVWLGGLQNILGKFYSKIKLVVILKIV
jgi:hypothetical protein